MFDSSSNKRPHFLIIGAGIAGLSAALMLSKLGMNITIVEKRTDLNEVGAGIQLGPNAVRCLSKMGLLQYLHDVITPPQSLNIYDFKSGTLISALALGDKIKEKYQAPYWTIARQDLHAVLKERLSANPLVHLYTGVTMLAYESHKKGMSVLIGADHIQARQINVIGIIGADGVHSIVRKIVDEAAEYQQKNALINKTKQKYKAKSSGLIAWRKSYSIDSVPKALATLDVSLFMGQGMHFVGYPIQTGNAYNAVFITKGRANKAGDFTMPAQLLGQKKIAPQLHELFQKNENDEGHWLPWTLWSGEALNPKTQKYAGAITFIGDAAHPVFPFLAQGAGFALEDAVTLAGLIETAADKNTAQSEHSVLNIQSAFRAYEKQRLKRWIKLQEASSIQKYIYHLPWPLSECRNIALGLAGEYLISKRTKWIYGWK